MAREPFGMDLWEYQDYKIQHEVYRKAKAFDEVIEIYDICYEHSDRNFIRKVDRVVDTFEQENNK